MIEVSHLQKKYGKLIVLKDVNFQIANGGIFAVLGPNGSGKTTILKSILGMVLPTKGQIQINDESVIGTHEYRNQIGYLPQIARFPDNLTVLELIAMIKDLRRQSANEDELIDLLELTPHLKKKLGGLSGGTRQKVNLVLTFMFDSEIFILDEPTAGLDPISLVKLKELIRNKRAEGKTIILTTHIMSLVEELADEIIFLLEGEIHYQGSITQLEQQTKSPTLEQSIATMLQNV
ncbi:MAG: ABC transporter ATP-binding protein [Cyclobacteriaceae bacterium]